MKFKVLQKKTFFLELPIFGSPRSSTPTIMQALMMLKWRLFITRSDTRNIRDTRDIKDTSDIKDTRDIRDTGDIRDTRAENFRIGYP